MDYSTLPSNSHASKEEAEEKKERVKKVVKDKVKVKKRSLRERLFSDLINKDASSIGDYIIDDLLRPTIKSTILSLITGSAERIFGGGGSPSKGVKYVDSNASYVDYTAASSKPKKRERSGRYDFRTAVFKSRSDAEDVKDALTALIEGQYKYASVADFYDLIGEDPEFTDNNYGWTNPKYFSVTYTNGGYCLNLPNPIPLK